MWRTFCKPIISIDTVGEMQGFARHGQDNDTFFPPLVANFKLEHHVKRLCTCADIHRVHVKAESPPSARIRFFFCLGEGCHCGKSMTAVATAVCECAGANSACQHRSGRVRCKGTVENRQRRKLGYGARVGGEALAQQLPRVIRVGLT